MTPEGLGGPREPKVALGDPKYQLKTWKTNENPGFGGFGKIPPIFPIGPLGPWPVSDAVRRCPTLLTTLRGMICRNTAWVLSTGHSDRSSSPQSLRQQDAKRRGNFRIFRIFMIFRIFIVFIVLTYSWGSQGSPGVPWAPQALLE